MASSTTADKSCISRLCRRLLPRKCRDDRIEHTSSWIKLVAVFMINVVIFTPLVSFGIFYDAIQERYDVRKSDVGWTMFVFAASGSLVAPLLSPFVVYYGCRPVALGSSTIYAVGMSLATIAPNVACFALLFGFLGGIGFGGLFLSTMSIIQQSFSHSRGCATSLSFLGYTCGGIVCPMIVELFLRQYGLSGALLLHGGLFVQTIAFSAILESPRQFVQKHQCPLRTVEPNKETRFSNGYSNPGNNPKVRSTLRTLFVNLLDFTVFKEYRFFICILHIFFFLIGEYSVFSHTVSASVHVGIPHKKAAYLFTILGVCNLVVRLSTGAILNSCKINPALFSCAGTVMLAASGLTLAYATSYVEFVVAIVLMALYEGTTATVFPMILVQLLGPERFARSFSLLRVCILPAPLLGAPIAGWLIDTTQDYKAVFLVVSAAAILSSVMATILYFTTRSHYNANDERRSAQNGDATKTYSVTEVDENV